MAKRGSKRIFRKLTAENWRDHDRTADHIVRIELDGSTSRVSDDDWVKIILETKLTPRVPQQIHNLFEVAQGALCYGTMFYPLYTLGSEQLYRVLDAALHHKCRQLGAPSSVRTFAQSIEWLRVQGLFSEKNYDQWLAARGLRNMASHAKRQSLLDPTMAVRNLRIASELMEDLFA